MSLLKHRSLSVEALDDYSGAKELEASLKTEKGVNEAKVDYGKSRIEISYDLEVTSLKNIEAFVQKNGARLSNSFWNRMQRGWLHYSEENEYDAAHVKAMPCCSHPDAILEKAHKH